MDKLYKNNISTNHKMKKVLTILIILSLLMLSIGCNNTTDDDKTRQGDNETTTTDPCEFCLGNYVPVCGEDGITYDNSCKTICQDIEIAHDGMCEADITYCEEDGECPEGMACDDGMCETYYSVTVCDISTQETWVKAQLLYYADVFDREYIYIPPGYYTRKEDNSGWMFRSHINTDSNYYTKTMDAILAGVMVNGQEIPCEITEEELPEGFQTFLDTHPVKFEEYIKTTEE
jgi:hypothetical protein